MNRSLMGVARSASLAVLAGLALAGAAGTAEAQHKWKVQNLYGPNTTVYKDFEAFAARVKEATKGQVEIQPFPVATIVPQAEALDAIKAGLLDGAVGTMAYQGGKEPAAAFWDMTAAYDNPLHLLMWYRQGGGMEIMNKIAAKWDAVFLGPVILGLESIPSKKPIRSIADFKGVKMRAPDGIPAEIFAKLGASVSVMPGTEVYTALDTGKIEATDWGTLSVNDEAGYNRIAPYAIYPGIHSMNSVDFVAQQAQVECAVRRAEGDRDRRGRRMVPAHLDGPGARGPQGRRQARSEDAGASGARRKRPSSARSLSRCGRSGRRRARSPRKSTKASSNS